jgi:Zn-dependent M28 family amino/carboxypeptidase
MRSRFLPLAAVSLFLAGCALATVVPQPVVNVAARSLGLKQRRNPETLVEKARLQQTLAILTGTAPMANGKTIPERGGIAGRELARQYLIGTMSGLGLQVERRKYRANGENILATLKATTATDEYIVIGAHMDSVNNRGADDDGSGSAAVLEAARVLSQMPERRANILFAWFDEEELGLVGSKVLAKELKQQGLKITSMHQIDMLGWDKDGDGAIELARPEGVLWDYYQMVNKTHGLNIPLHRTNTGQSDHVSFANQGYKSVLLIEEYVNGDTTPFYHRKTDTIDTINFDFLTGGTKLVTAVVSDMAMQVPAPKGSRFVPHENFPKKDLHCHGGDSTTDHAH